jgi:hypothetical protein
MPSGPAGFYREKNEEKAARSAAFLTVMERALGAGAGSLMV